MKKSSQIRNQFIDFFREHGHTFVPSAPVIPADDPTLLFTNAGMNQFKDMFLEQGSRSYSRAVNSQKCIRVSGKHNDLEEVGSSPHHHTFFEMLGNWSFGDYYKRDAIKWAWELLTDVWGMDPKRLYATIYEGDDDVPMDEEARQAWLDETGIASDRITPHGKKDNFWEMGEIGPCGPCSEVHYDLGEDFCDKKGDPHHICCVNGDCGRIVELWNLVFIQFRRDATGELHPLPHRHVDTGAGFERIVRVLEGVNSNYETSLFTPIISRIADLSGVPYEPDEQGIPHRVAADHIRALAFSLVDGVLPSNEGRGYVLRRILRRAARYGREIGLETPFLYHLVAPLISVMGDAYPELNERYEHIVGVIHAEEESFARTLGRGLEIFGEILEKMEKKGLSVVSGDDAFKLYDTYGFPLDLTQLMARERSLLVDRKRFDLLMAEQRRRARGDAKFSVNEGDFLDGFVSEFVGYDKHKVDSQIISVNRRNNQEIDIVLESTPFYAEAGGQVSDDGFIETEVGILTVTEVYHIGEMIVHRGLWDGDDFPESGMPATARINSSKRLSTQRNHTATHLLHTALRTYLGQHASQAGSLVAPDRLRFDFTHFERLTPEQIELIERTVNDAIRENYLVKWYYKSYQEAVKSGITALFGEKYGDVVRIVRIGLARKPYSRELCGGTHVKRTGDIGLFRIVSEGSVSAGVRRIEAVTGEKAFDLTIIERDKLDKIKYLLNSYGSDPVEKLSLTLAEKKALEKELESMLIAWAGGVAVELIASAELINGVSVIAKNFDGLEMDRLKLIGDAVRSRVERVAALLTSPSLKGSGHLCCVVGDALIAEGKLQAGQLVAQAAKIAGGGGGGRPHMATAGTRHPEKLTDAVTHFSDIIHKVLN